MSTTLTGDSWPYRVMSMRSLLLVIAPDQQDFLMDAHVQGVAFQICMDNSFNIYRELCIHNSMRPFAGLLLKLDMLQRYASDERMGVCLQSEGPEEAFALSCHLGAQDHREVHGGR